VKRIVFLLTLIPALGNALHADWKIVTRTGDSSVVEYFKGTLMRTDSSPAYTSVLDLDHRRQVTWRSDLRQYVIVESPPEYKSDSSGPVVTIERNTTDAGERQQFFGRTARHFVTHITRSDGPDTVTDGWYIDAPRLPSLKGTSGNTVAVLTAGVGGPEARGSSDRGETDRPRAHRASRTSEDNCDYDPAGWIA
jgi:hypothetical protein